jgi:two-component system chemotaxis response regulator CheB
MGSDGAQGLLNMRRAGARTLAQDERSCVVFGMPAEAIRCGAAETTVPLREVATTMISLAQHGAVPVYS